MFTQPTLPLHVTPQHHHKKVSYDPAYLKIKSFVQIFCASCFVYLFEIIKENYNFYYEENADRTWIEECLSFKNSILQLYFQFAIFEPLSYCFEEAIGFDVKGSFASRPLSRLIIWYKKPGDMTKEFREKAIRVHGAFHGLKMASCFL